MKRTPYASIWDAIEDTPQEAASMRARADLMIQLTEVIRKRGLSQAEAVTLFEATQSRVSDLMRGKLDLFSIDTLINIAAIAGLSRQIKLKKAV